VQIRPAATRDAEAICAIYNWEVEATAATFDLIPRSLADQLAWLEDHAGAYPALVAVAEAGEDFPAGQVLGFASLSPYRDRPGYATTVENSVYVDRAARGRGIAKALLRALIDQAAAQGFHSIIARITGENGTSVTLHESVGFTLVGIEREVGRKHGRWLDVIELQLLLD